MTIQARMSKVKKRSNVLVFVYEWMLVLVPWAVMLGMLQVHFQRLLPYQRFFKGEYFFDFFTVTDITVSVLLAVFMIGFFTKKIRLVSRKLPREVMWVILLLMIAGMLELLFQKSYDPVLTTPSDYLRGLFIYPILYFLLLSKTASDGVIRRVLFSYVWMVAAFSFFALLQFFTGIFPGAQKDFMGRLTWPYIDLLTLKSSSANWAAFFCTPAFILSFIRVGRFHVAAKENRNISVEDWLFIVTLVLSGIVIFLAQSYGAFVAILAALALYLFRSLPPKKFLIGFLGLLLVAGGLFLAATQTSKYEILTGQKQYQYDNSIVSRGDIYRMNLSMIATHPILGVGLNAYQSYFTKYHQQVLGHAYGESLIPPHAHNFFMGFWVSLGFLGFAAMFILMVSIFWRTRFSPDSPAAFVFLAIMIHGVIDSYYWRQEIAYTFWFVVALCYVFRFEKR